MSKPELPRDLIDRGFRLIRLKQSERLMVVSTNRGGSIASHNLPEIIQSARAIAGYIEQREKGKYE